MPSLRKLMRGRGFEFVADSWHYCPQAKYLLRDLYLQDICSRYTEISAFGDKPFCWVCGSVDDPPPECQGYLDEDKSEAGGAESSSSTTALPEEGGKEDNADAREGKPSDNNSKNCTGLKSHGIKK